MHRCSTFYLIETKNEKKTETIIQVKYRRYCVGCDSGATHDSLLEKKPGLSKKPNETNYEVGLKGHLKIPLTF